MKLRKNIKETHKEHLERKEEVRVKKEADKLDATNSDTVCLNYTVLALVFDLQKVLTTPKCDVVFFSGT